MDQQTREWFKHRAGSPDFVAGKFFPAIERVVDRTVRDLRQAERDGDLNKIKYAIGRFDGVHEIVELFKNLKLSELSEDEKRSEPALMVRILKSFR